MTGPQTHGRADLAFAAPLARYVASPAYRELCRRVHRDDRPWFDLMEEVQRERLWSSLDPQPGERVLDLGCGAGALGSWLTERTPVHVVGLDLALAALAGARFSGSRAAVGDMTRLPFPAGAFDAVTAVDSLYFLAAPYLDHALAETARCLRPGGRLVVLASDLDPGSTDTPRLAHRLAAHGLAVNGVDQEDLTRHENTLWRRKRQALDALRADFTAEGAADLWDALDAETRRGLELMEAGRVRRWLMMGING